MLQSIAQLDVSLLLCMTIRVRQSGHGHRMVQIGGARGLTFSRPANATWPPHVNMLLRHRYTELGQIKCCRFEETGQEPTPGSFR